MNGLRTNPKCFTVSFFVKKKDDNADRGFRWDKLGSVDVWENINPAMDQYFPLVAKAFRHCDQKCRAAEKVTIEPA